MASPSSRTSPKSWAAPARRSPGSNATGRDFLAPLWTRRRSQAPRRNCSPLARNPAAADAPRCGLAAERANELARAGAHVAQELTHISQSRAELGIAYLDRHHRALELGEHGASFGNRNDGAVA